MDFEKLAAFRLRRGPHYTPEDGLCAMEAVAWLEGEPHSDFPECACPILASFVQGLNDGFDGDDRQKLVPYLPRLVGTNDPKSDHVRGKGIFQAACDAGVTRSESLVFEPDHRLFFDLGIRAARELPLPEALAILDAALAIGAPSPGFSTDVETRVAEYRALIEA